MRPFKSRILCKLSLDMKLTTLLSLLFIICCSIENYATHNRAGEITYEQIGELTIRATITTYTKTSSSAADRDSVEIFWGDGTTEWVLRSNGQGDLLPNDIKVNRYIAEHTYPGRGTYTISMTDPNRVASILNVNFPNSVNVPFYLETTFTLLNPLFQGRNNSVTLLQPPIDFSCVGQVFVHNPNAFDADGDSLAYEFTIPRFERDQAVPEYLFPDEISPGEDNQIALDPITGTFTWNSPQRPGEYNIAFRIKEFRSGVLINSTVRDMQVFVRNCTDAPPEIEVVESICVVAGELVTIDLLVNDPDSFDLVSVSATGGPFEFEESSAAISNSNIFQSTPINAIFSWQTTCDHISQAEYQVVFRAVDNSFGDTTGLADLKTLRIKVIGPPPQDLQAIGIEDRVDLSWEFPYECEETEVIEFLGFSVWRKVGSSEISQDSCYNGLGGTGYQEVIFITKDNDGSRYNVSDTNVESGVIYCYRILAEFSQLTDSGNPFNRVSSIASNEVCMILKQDFPLITKVSVVETDINDGVVDIAWTKPSPTDLDTIQNPGPYRYQLLRSDGNSAFEDVIGASFIIENFSDIVDTFFTDSNLNTSDNRYDYQIAFYDTDITENSRNSFNATSVFLNVSPTDQAINLSWTSDVPWQNREYIIYRVNGDNLDSLGTSISREFTDQGLINDQEYCYVVTALGSYGLDNVPQVLVNNSQIACGAPSDDVAPCAPGVTVENVCTAPNLFDDAEALFNIIRWEVEDDCETLSDLAGYQVYFSTSMDDNGSVVGTLDGQSNRVFEHSPSFGVAGCYSVSSLDEKGNESVPSAIICTENCPTYQLPNSFTPNSDGANDLFTPISSQFIARVEMEIYNRWGQKVFVTDNPAIDWDGTNLSGKTLEDGVYYYTCVVFEQKLNEIEERSEILNGFIHLIKGE